MNSYVLGTVWNSTEFTSSPPQPSREQEQWPHWKQGCPGSIDRREQGVCEVTEIKPSCIRAVNEKLSAATHTI